MTTPLPLEAVFQRTSPGDWYLKLRGTLRPGEIKTEKTFREVSAQVQWRETLTSPILYFRGPEAQGDKEDSLASRRWRRDSARRVRNGGVGGVPQHCVSITRVPLSRPPHLGIWSVRPPVDRCG
jgi:hypothetical protein